MGTLIFAIASLGVLVAMVKAHADIRVSAHSWHRRQARAAAATYAPPATPQPQPRFIIVPANEDEEMASVFHGFEHVGC